MASLWDKLTGKAPMVESPENNKTEGTEISAKKESSNDTSASKPSLLAKLTGKAPMIDDSDKSSTDGNAQKSSVKDSKAAEAIKAHVFNNNDLKIVAKWAVPIVVCAILVFVTKTVVTSMTQPLKDELAGQNSQMTAISNNINAKNLEFQALESNEQYREKNNTSSDVDTSEDDAVAAEFFRHYTTWSDDPSTRRTAGAVYQDLCNELKAYREAHPNLIDESFAVSLLPLQGSWTDVEGNGETYYQVDFEHRNLTYQSLESYPITGSNANGGNATQYAALITLTSKEQNGNIKYYHVYAVYMVDRRDAKNPELSVQRVAVLTN